MTTPYGKSIDNGNFAPGFRALDGNAVNRALSKIFQGGLSRADNLTATSGGTKAAAFQMARSLNRFATVAADNDSALLPKAIAGSIVTVINSGGHILGVYGTGADTIDGQVTATQNSIASTKAKIYACVTKGAWFTVSAVA